MKKCLIGSAIALVLVASGPALAQSFEHCMDEACRQRSMFQPEVSSGGQGSGAVAAPRFGPWGIDLAGMDKSVRPGDDFFGYVNGTWAKNTTIPPDRASYGAFVLLNELAEARLHKMLESYALGDLAMGGGKVNDTVKIAALYRAYLDETIIEKLDDQPLRPLLDEARAAKSREQLAELMGRAHSGFGRSFFGAAVFGDQRYPDRYALYLRQSGLGLGDREMYLDSKFAKQKARYEEYAAQLLRIIDWPEPSQTAKVIVDMETTIAEAHWTRAESRDRDKTYNPRTVAELQREAPGFPWATFFKAAGIDHAERAVVSQVTAFPAIAKVFAEADLDTLRAWHAFHSVDTAAPLLSKRFVDAHFEFRSRFLSGQPEQRARWKRAVSFAESAMGEAIGREYVSVYFPPDAKAKMDALVANVKDAMRARLQTLEWMGPATRKEALAKLDNFGLKIGHPERWRDYSKLEVVNGDLFGNARRAERFEWDFRRARIGQAVDEGEWGMTPQTVNAYYNAVNNEIVFPAAILQAPFFDPDADAAVNYGAIGGVIGHEIIHGFDDQGRKSDGAGMLRDWWAAEDAKKFEAQAVKLAAQYESYEFPQLPGLKINGRNSMGENIGDLGGLIIALEAYRRSLGGKPAPVLDGFTAEQRLFMGWAQVWRTLFRDDALRQQLVNGTHSPGQIRAFAPLRNIDQWYEAFDVKPDDRLWIAPQDRVRIW